MAFYGKSRITPDETDFKYPRWTIHIANIYGQQRYRINSSQVVHEVHTIETDETMPSPPARLIYLRNPLRGWIVTSRRLKQERWHMKRIPFMLQTFRHGFPHQPTALAFDPVQRLLAIGTKSGSLRMYPSTLSLIRGDILQLNVFYSCRRQKRMRVAIKKTRKSGQPVDISNMIQFFSLFFSFFLCTVFATA